MFSLRIFRLLALSVCMVLAGQSLGQVNAGEGNKSTRYGAFELLDSRSRYGKYWFPEPFRVGEVDVDNEIRFDWVHTEGHAKVADGMKFELEKSFGLLTIELELPYERESSRIDLPGGGSGREKSRGFGNVELSARHPIYQWVSADNVIDCTFGFKFEVAIPTNSPISKHTELVPAAFAALRVGEHFSLQSTVGYSFLLGSDPDGGAQSLEYSAVLGYSINNSDLKLPGIDRVVPILELKGSTDMNHGSAGHNYLSGTAGVRFNLKSMGALQPRIGLGYVFPIDKSARDDFSSGFVFSLIFEF